jgi:hypothetical protein
MTFALHQPILPNVPLDQCSDKERKINQRCWNIAGVQAALAADEMRLVLSSTASTQIAIELAWSMQNVYAFFKVLAPYRYYDSEWCRPPAHGNKFGPMPADSYLMGFDRISGAENQLRQPYIYIKFSIREKAKTVLVLTCHPSRY